jgi:nitrogen fixation NifU-like protein
MYSEKVMEHFANPRNTGTIADADGVGEVGNPVCGDMMTFFIKVRDGRLTDIKFQTFGCVAAIAVSSMVSEMAKGKTIAEARSITQKAVAESLDGLPKEKMHCSNLGAQALGQAISDYEARKSGQPPSVRKATQTEEVECATACPYCRATNPAEAKYCMSCGKRLAREA